MNLIEATAAKPTTAEAAIKAAASWFRADLSKLRDDLDDPVAKEAVGLAMTRLSQRATLPGYTAQILSGQQPEAMPAAASKPTTPTSFSEAHYRAAAVDISDLSADAILARRRAQETASRIASAAPAPVVKPNHGWDAIIERVNAQTARQNPGVALASGAKPQPASPMTKTTGASAADGWAAAYARVGLKTKAAGR